MIEKLLSKARKVQQGLQGAYFKKIVDRYAAEICDLNTEEQLFEKGENALGVEIARYDPYSPFTIQYKIQKGQPYNRVTLRDEGDFHSSVKVIADLQGFSITATDSKTEDLQDRYGKILGLTPENVRYVSREYVYPDLLNKIKMVFNENI